MDHYMVSFACLSAFYSSDVISPRLIVVACLVEVVSYAPSSDVRHANATTPRVKLSRVLLCTLRWAPKRPLC